MEADYQNINFDSKAWMLKPILASILYATGSFLIGVNNLNPYFVKLLISMGYLLSGILGILFILIFHSSSRNSKYEPGFIPSALCGVFSHFANFSLILGYYYDPQNQGIISIITIGSSVVCSITSYILYKEKLERLDILGMTICIVGLFVIGIFSNDASESSFIGFNFGLSALFCFSVADILPKIASASGINPYKSTVISMLFEAFSGFANVGILAIFFDVFDKYDDFWIALIAGAMFGFGNFALNLGIIEGKIGIAIVIVDFSGVLQMGLDYVFRDFIPDSGKLTGGFIALIGVSILLLWKDIVK